MKITLIILQYKFACDEDYYNTQKYALPDI